MAESLLMSKLLSKILPGQLGILSIHHWDRHPSWPNTVTALDVGEMQMCIRINIHIFTSSNICTTALCILPVTSHPVWVLGL